MTGDLRINDIPELRSRYAAGAASEQMTYEEFLRNLLAMYEQYPDKFEQAQLKRDRSR